MCSETNLYGDWMMVQPRRRGSSYSARKVTTGINSSGQQSGSRFGVLVSENLEAGRDASFDVDDGDGTAVAGERSRFQETRFERH
ncbi:hypothetical protein V6N13_106268 [Hibiscus sabdariffa]